MHSKKHSKMKNKKSTVAINMMILLALAIFIFLVLAYIVPNLLKKGSSETSAYLNDEDKDGVKDAIDKCPCQQGKEEYNGCEESPDGNRNCLK